VNESDIFFDYLKLGVVELIEIQLVRFATNAPFSGAARDNSYGYRFYRNEPIHL